MNKPETQSGGSLEPVGSAAPELTDNERLAQLREEIWAYEHRKLSDAEGREMIMDERLHADEVP